MELLKIITQHQKTIKKAFWVGYAGLLAVFAWTVVSPAGARYWHDLGEFSATIAIVSLWLSLTPGILKRLQIAGIFLPIRTGLMMFRRQLGVSMYVAAFVHYFWSRILPILALGGDLFSVSPFETFGFLAFLLATPLWLTSNDFSQHGPLKKIWRPLHKLVYVIIWLLVFHIGLQEFGTKALITLLVAGAEVVSLGMEWQRKRAIRPEPQSQN